VAEVIPVTFVLRARLDVQRAEDDMLPCSEGIWHSDCAEVSVLRYLGYVAIALSIEATTNRTCRLRNATDEHLRKLIRANLTDLGSVLEFNGRNGLRMYRISSQIVPFASHPINQVRWWDEFADVFDHLAEIVARHRFRVSIHPGQFTVLSSPSLQIVEAAVKDVEWHARFLDCLRTDDSAKIVIHGGGAYGEKAEAMDRFVEAISRLPEGWRRRLVLENDERVYSVEDVLDLGKRVGIPVVFDWLHHWANPGESAPGDVTPLMARCFDTWKQEDGPPKVHFSSQAPGGRLGQHADWIDAGEFARFLSLAPDREFDCMLEAKKKELALLKLRGELGLGSADAIL
jgi:UV DNA damage endonuclease